MTTLLGSDASRLSDDDLDIGLRASVVVLMALVASVALRRQSAALRHWVLAAGILSAAAVAPLGVALPAWDLPAPAAESQAPLVPATAKTAIGDSERSPGKAEVPPAAPRTLAIEPIINVVRAAFWFNPLFWMACARLRRESEAACDDAVLEAGVPAAVSAGDTRPDGQTFHAPHPGPGLRGLRRHRVGTAWRDPDAR